MKSSALPFQLSNFILPWGFFCSIFISCIYPSLLIGDYKLNRIKKIEGGVVAPNPNSATNPDESTSQEFNKAQREQKETIQQLNRVNPLSTEQLPLGKDVLLPRDSMNLDEKSSKLRDSINKIQAVLSNPLLQKYAKVMSSGEMSQLMQNIIQHPYRNVLIGCEIFWIICIFFFRAWRLSLSEHWLGRLWTGTWIIFLFSFGSLAIPFLVLGDSYTKLVILIFKTVV